MKSRIVRSWRPGGCSLAALATKTPALLRTDAFNEFYAARKAALLAIVESAMGKVSAESASVAEDEDSDDEEDEAA